MKELYFLLAIINGHEYVDGRHMTLGECIDRKIFFNNETVYLIENAMPLLKVEYKCARE